MSESNFMVSEAQIQLSEARKQKSERIKNSGSPIQLSGKALGIEVTENFAWVAENTAVARKIDLETGETLQLYKGHKAPVTCLAFYNDRTGEKDHPYLVTGSWDKCINIWDTDTKKLISSTPNAHGDFIKSLLVLPSAKLLVSSGSDKIIRFWHLEKPSSDQPLKSTGSISAHTRPVECLAVYETSPDSLVLYTADTMGLIICWELTRMAGEDTRWRAVQQKEYSYHRTRINDISYGAGQLWTASSDDTIQVLVDPSTGRTHVLNHPVAVKAILHLGFTDIAEPYLISGAGDYLRVWDVTDPAHPELINELDAHWHDVTAIRFWKRTQKIEGAVRVEPMIVSTSLDGTIRKWRLTDLLTRAPTAPPEPIKAKSDIEPKEVDPAAFQLSEEEQRELDELMDSD